MDCISSSVVTLSSHRHPRRSPCSLRSAQQIRITSSPFLSITFIRSPGDAARIVLRCLCLSPLHRTIHPLTQYTVANTICTEQRPTLEMPRTFAPRSLSNRSKHNQFYFSLYSLSSSLLLLLFVSFYCAPATIVRQPERRVCNLFRMCDSSLLPLLSLSLLSILFNELCNHVDASHLIQPHEWQRFAWRIRYLFARSCTTWANKQKTTTRIYKKIWIDIIIVLTEIKWKDFIMLFLCLRSVVQIDFVCINAEWSSKRGRICVAYRRCTLQFDKYFSVYLNSIFPLQFSLSLPLYFRSKSLSSLSFIVYLNLDLNVGESALLTIVQSTCCIASLFNGEQCCEANTKNRDERRKLSYNYILLLNWTRTMSWVGRDFEWNFDAVITLNQDIRLFFVFFILVCLLRLFPAQ